MGIGQKKPERSCCDGRHIGSLCVSNSLVAGDYSPGVKEPRLQTEGSIATEVIKISVGVYFKAFN